jgi:isopenicillin N synthase-like dioxygenase
MNSYDVLEESGVAVVDFSAFLDGSNKQGVADAISSSFKDVGFVCLLNHGIPLEMIAKIFGAVRRGRSNP